MPSVTDPQRRPVYIDRVNNRLLAEPIGAGPWFAVNISQPPPTVPPASLTEAGIVQLNNNTSSNSTATAATPSAVKAAYDLASAALPRSGGAMTGAITFAAGQTLSGYAALASAQSFTAAQRGSVVALTDGTTITPDFAAGNNFSVTLGGNRTLANPTNLTAGQSGVIVITQDGTGSRTLAYGSNWKFPGGTVPTLTTAASAVDVVAYYCESATRITAQLIPDVK